MSINVLGADAEAVATLVHRAELAVVWTAVNGTVARVVVEENVAFRETPEDEMDPIAAVEEAEDAEVVADGLDLEETWFHFCYNEDVMKESRRKAKKIMRDIETNKENLKKKINK